MNGNFKLRSWLARNPLATIAAFIFLIEAMSALLLGAAGDSLASHNQTILVIFIVLFPFFVLGMFGWLVANHHTKLYGPGDFRTDQGFMDAITVDIPSSLGERLEREIEEEQKAGQEVSDGGPHISEQPAPTGDTHTVKGSKLFNKMLNALTRNQLMVGAYLAESLVFQELQNELNGAVKREVALSSSSGNKLRADGVIQTEQGTVVVEIKIINNPNVTSRILHTALVQLSRYGNALQKEGVGNVSFLLAVVVRGDISDAAKAGREVERFKQDVVGNNLTIRVFSHDQLLEKYGFPIEEKEEGEEAVTEDKDAAN